jgi:hypothetical protein
MEESQEIPEIVENNDGSFESRMQERRRQREQRTSEVFDVPGFEDLFKVEMKVLGYKRLADLALPHSRVRDDSLRQLYISADQVIAATVGFHKIMEDGSLREAEGATWMDMAKAFDPSLDGTVKPRAALIRLLDGTGVLELSNDWYTWNARGNVQVDKDLGADFRVTT